RDSGKEFQNLDYVILTEEFREMPIVEIIKQHEFEEIHGLNDIQIVNHTYIKCFFQEKGGPLIFKRIKKDEKKESLNIVSYMQNIPVSDYMANITVPSFVTNCVEPVAKYVSNVNYVANLVPIAGEIYNNYISSEPSIKLIIEQSSNIQNNKSDIPVDISSIITYLQHTLKDGNIKTMLLTSDNDASWILE
ncbi:5803_t:CDS:1, partial [Racocetra persica]